MVEWGREKVREGLVKLMIDIERRLGKWWGYRERQIKREIER